MVEFTFCGCENIEPTGIAVLFGAEVAHAEEEEEEEEEEEDKDKEEEEGGRRKEPRKADFIEEF